jgi:hypothetical protein
MRVSVIDRDGRPVPVDAWDSSAAAELVVSLPGAEKLRRYADGNGALAVMTSHNPKEKA